MPDNDDNHPGKIPSAPHRRDDPRLQPVSNRGLAIFIAALAAALVLGYLFVNKLAGTWSIDAPRCHPRSRLRL